MLWLWIICAPLLLLFIALCLPIDLILTLCTEPDLTVEGRVRWLFFTVKRIKLLPLAAQPEQKKERVESLAAPLKPQTGAKTRQKKRAGPDAKKKVKQEPQTKKRLSLPMPIADIKFLVAKYVPLCWRALNLSCLKGHFHLALDHPAAYGWMYGVMGATGLPQQPFSLQVTLNEEASMQADCSWRSRLYPIQWLWLGLRVVFAKPIRAIWWGKLRKKGENKRVKHQSVHRAAGEPYFQQDGNRRSHSSG